MAWLLLLAAALALMAGPAQAGDQELIMCQQAYLQALATAGTNKVMQCAAVNELVRCGASMLVLSHVPRHHEWHDLLGNLKILKLLN
jgi:hypothetical protein